MTWSLFGKLVSLLMKERMEYRANFMLGAVAQIISYAGEYIVIWLFITKFQTIAGWTWPEIALLYSIGLFTYALGASFSFVQMAELGDQVRAGTFDAILTKPVNPYLYLISRGFNLGYIAHVIISGSVLIWAVTQLDVYWNPLRVLYFVLIVLSGAMIQAGIMSAIGAMSFLWIRTRFLFTLFFRLKDFISYPLPVFGTFIQIVLTFCVPLAFINFFPAAFLLSHDTPLLPGWGMWLVPAVGPLCYAVGYRLWMYGVNKYQGAGG